MNRIFPFYLVAVALTFAGCTTAAKKPKSDSYGVYDRAPATIDRSLQVTDRANELLRTGKYPTRASALRAAEKDFPDGDTGAEADWTRARAAARERQATQDKFVTDLRKMGN